MKFGLMPVAGAERPFMAISKEEFDAVCDAKAALLQCLAVEEAFDFVVENCEELERALLDVALTHMAHPDPASHHFNEDRGLFNRRLMNWLTAVKSYVEKVPKHARAISKGSGARATAAMTDARSEALGLGGMLALRNYIQHHDSVVHRVTYGSKFVGKMPGGQLAFSVNPVVDLTNLGADDLRNKSDRQVLEELQSLGPQLELIPLARKCLEDLWNAHSLVRGDLAPLAENLERVLATIKDKYLAAHPQVSPGSGLAAVTREPDQDPVEEVHLVWSFSDYRKHLETKNCALDSISGRFVTSEGRGREDITST